MCNCSDCSACGLTTLPINEFYAAADNCTVPGAWSTSFVSVPLINLAASNTTLSRISISYGGTLPVTCTLDNLLLS